MSKPALERFELMRSENKMTRFIYQQLSRFASWRANEERETAMVCARAASVAFFRDEKAHGEFSRAMREADASRKKWEARAERWGSRG